MSTTTTNPVVLVGDELAFPSDFLSWADLKGQPRTVTIETLTKEVLERKGKKRSGDKPKLVATLVGKQKKFVINRTNAERIAGVLGNQALAWVGHKIVIQPDTCQFGRDTVNCTRVNVELTRKANALKPAPMPQPEAAPAEAWDDDPPVDEVAIAALAAEAERS